MPKRNSPGRCVCCGNVACFRCVRVLGCPGVGGVLRGLSGATVTLRYQDPNTGVVTTFGPGTTNSQGEVCIEVPAAFRYGEIGYTVSASGFLTRTGKLDYTQQCGKVQDVQLTPGTDGGGGVSGRLTLTMSDCAGTTAGITGKQIGLYRSINPTVLIDSKTFTSSGVVVFTGVPVGESVFVGGLNFETFPPFMLSCEGAATARTTESGFCSQQWAFTSIACGSTSSSCCAACAGSVANVLNLDDPEQLDPWVLSGPLGSCIVPTDGVLGPPTPLPASCSARGTTPLLISRTTFAGEWSRVSPVRYDFRCLTTGGAQLEVRVPCVWVGSSGDCASYEAQAGGVGWFVRSQLFWRVNASSITCSPFVATFSLPAQTVTLYQRICNFRGCFLTPCGSCTVPPRTITVYE